MSFSESWQPAPAGFGVAPEVDTHEPALATAVDDLSALSRLAWVWCAPCVGLLRSEVIHSSFPGVLLTLFPGTASRIPGLLVRYASSFRTVRNVLGSIGAAAHGAGAECAMRNGCLGMLRGGFLLS